MTGLAQFLIAALMLVPALLIAIPLHELGHAVAAYFLGDRSVRYFGYLDLSPGKVRRLFDLHHPIQEGHQGRQVRIQNELHPRHQRRRDHEYRDRRQGCRRHESGERQVPLKEQS